MRYYDHKTHLHPCHLLRQREGCLHEKPRCHGVHLSRKRYQLKDGYESAREGAEGRGLHESPQHVLPRKQGVRGAQQHEFHEREHGDREKASGRGRVQDGGDDAAHDKGDEACETKGQMIVKCSPFFFSLCIFVFWGGGGVDIMKFALKGTASQTLTCMYFVMSVNNRS